MENLPIANTLTIRECGLDEYWLQDQIYNNPNCLGLGELDAIDKERRQSSRGRLDILLKNPEDDSMFEVEVMLGETDESHIIRTIEYWDNEKRKWPQRQHYAVLVAESITRRFFNVIQLLSHSIPIIAIQTNIIEVAGQKSLNFVKVLDTFEEIDDGSSINSETFDEKYWQTKAQWVLETADVLQTELAEVLGETALNYTKHYVAITSHNNNYFWLNKRSAGKILLSFRVASHLMDEAKEALDENSIAYIHKGKSLRITTDKKAIKGNKELFVQIARMASEYWNKD
ncbi:MAG: hypothetical protein JAZ17_20770 [Candidatus Thiodiazotropha endolucinida]|nr:hypothetical protein [Candidatus Thiodiazotropha endolucinida]